MLDPRSHSADPLPMIEKASRGIDLDAPLELARIGVDRALAFYRTMVLVRRFEERVEKITLEGRIPSTVHLSNGQEAIAVGTIAALRATDWILGTHRGHGQAIAKGIAPGSLLAELLCRADGCCRGFGGSMHVGDTDVRMVPALAVMGDQVPIGAGIAFAARARGQDDVVVVFVGDGAMSTGALHEGLNLAAVWRLPLIVVCENNFYAISTPLTLQMRLDRVSDRARAYGLPGVTIDGNDVVSVFETVNSAVAAARAGDGPALVECLTYRHAAHKGAFGIGSQGSFRDDREMAMWTARDPLLRLHRALEDRVPIAALEAADEAARAAVDEAVRFAEASPLAVEPTIGAGAA